MKKRLGTLAICGAMMIFSAPLLAQPYGDDHDHGRRDDHGHHDRRHDDRDRGDRGDGYDRHHEYRGHDRDRYADWHDRGRHEGWYRRGGYLPVEYRTRYVVTDWRRDRLRAPPRGYHWVRSDNGDFLLVAITSGIIADLILHH